MRKLDTKQSTISSSVVKKPPDPTEKGLLTLKSNACREINVKIQEINIFQLYAI